MTWLEFAKTEQEPEKKIKLAFASFIFLIAIIKNSDYEILQNNFGFTLIEFNCSDGLFENW